MTFEETMRQWKEEHLNKRTGERLRRLNVGFLIPEQMLLEREALRFAYSQKDCIVRVKDVQLYLCVGKDTTRSMM